MTRILAGAALVTILIGSASAYAAATPSPTPAAAQTPTHTATAPIDYAARCTSLADQWKSAETANASNKSLGKAKADAARGAKYCKSTKVAVEKKGVKSYQAALKLLGVTPT